MTIGFTNVGFSANFHEPEPRPNYPGAARNVVAAGGYPEFGELLGQGCREAGVTRAWVHNPGGVWPGFPTEAVRPDDPTTPDEDEEWNTLDDRNRATAMGFGKNFFMSPYQWLLAEWNQIGWADRGKLTLFHLTLVEQYGIEEVVYYIGGPQGLPYDVQFACCEPFLHEGASLAFDHVITVEHFEQCSKLFSTLSRKHGCKIYTEARPFEDIPAKLCKYVDGTVARGRFDLTNPDRLARAADMGEVIRLTLNDGDNHPDDGATTTLTVAL